MSSTDVTRIAGNIAALNSLNSLRDINNQLAIHQTRLATGKRINSSSDDPAGMSMATTFDVQRQGLSTALSSIGDAKNLMSTMEGGLTKIQDILIKMRNKANEAQGDTIGDSEREAILSQMQAYRDEIDDIVDQTQWNGTNLLSGAGGSGSTASLDFLTSPDATNNTSAFAFKAQGSSISANQGFQASSGSVGSATGLGLDDTMLTDANLSSGSVAQAIDDALDIVKAGISQTGSFTARLTFKEEALTVQYTNTEAAYNRIMNADMASEQVEASKYTILQQTATAMLAQANSAPQFVLSLFQ